MYRATRAYIEAFVSALSARTDLEFIEGNKFGVNLKDKQFMYDPILLQQMSIDEVKGVLLHEVGHLNYSEHITTKDSKEFAKYPHLSTLYNAMEDMRIEHRIIKEFQTFALFPIADSRLYATESNFYNLKSGHIDNIPPYYAFIGMLYSYLLYDDERPLRNLEPYPRTYMPWQNLISEYSLQFGNSLAPLLPEKIGARFTYPQHLRDLMQKIDKCSREKELVHVVDTEIVPYIRELLDEEKGRAEAMHGAEEFVKAAVEAMADAASQAEQAYDKLQTTHTQLRNIIERGGGGPRGRKTEENEIPPEEEIHALFGLASYNIQRYLGSIIEEKKATRYTGAHKRGKLLARNVYKALTKERRMYSKRINPNVPDAEVTFCIDESGSMDGALYRNAYIAADIINRACENLKFKIHYFGFESTTHVYQKMTDLRESHSGGTNMKTALRKIDKTIDRNNINIIFFLTDGEPNPSDEPTEFVEKFKKEGVHLVAIGMGLGSGLQFRKYFPKGILAESIEDLVKKMSQELKSIIHR